MLASVQAPPAWPGRDRTGRWEEPEQGDAWMQPVQALQQQRPPEAPLPPPQTAFDLDEELAALEAHTKVTACAFFVMEGRRPHTSYRHAC